MVCPGHQSQVFQEDPLVWGGCALLVWLLHNCCRHASAAVTVAGFLNMGPATQVRGHFEGMPVLAEAARQVRRTGDIYFFFSSQTVSSFIKDTFHKQSWYFRQDMGRQSLTVYNFQTPFFNGLPKSESHYKTQ